MNILVTGAAGFIGFFTAKALLKRGHVVLGLDDINDYYDVNLKYARLQELGISRPEAEPFNTTAKSANYPNFTFIRLKIQDRENLPDIFKANSFDVVCNLAAQAGVRYSIENPEAYVDSNVVGFLNILESCRNYGVKHLVYASSSSIYGQTQKMRFETDDFVDKPISLYAATKKSNELMAHAYSHLYQFKTTGLRFFTVYGPWGRPDMAPSLFADAILHHRPLNVFNHGKLERDFTYVDDIAEGVLRVVETPLTHENLSDSRYKIYNIGNNKSINLMDFITAMEQSLGLKANKKMLPMQPGDVERTWANVDGLIKDYGYCPNTPLKIGVENFITWYKSFYLN